MIIRMLSKIQRKDYLSSRVKSETSSSDEEKEKESPVETKEGKPDLDYLNSYIPLEQLPRRLSPKTIITIRGHYEKGVLSGLMNVEYADGTSAEGFAVDGAWHGIVRHFATPFKKGNLLEFEFPAKNFNIF